MGHVNGVGYLLVKFVYLYLASFAYSDIIIARDLQVIEKRKTGSKIDIGCRLLELENVFIAFGIGPLKIAIAYIESKFRPSEDKNIGQTAKPPTIT